MALQQKKTIAFIFLALFASLGAGRSEEMREEIQKEPEFSLPSLYSWRGDFDGMMERRTIRILVPYSKTLFFISKGKEYGIVAELGQELERWINAKEHTGSQFFRVVLIPKKRDELLSALISGEGDIVAGNLRVTPERREIVDFTMPTLRNVKEIIVTGPASPAINTLDDLSGTDAYVCLSSTYAQDLELLNDQFEKSGKKLVNIKALDENLEDEDILEMVNAGMLPYAIVHQNIGDLWQRVFTNIKVRDDIAVAPGGILHGLLEKDRRFSRKNSRSLLAIMGRKVDIEIFSCTNIILAVI